MLSFMSKHKLPKILSQKSKYAFFVFLEILCLRWLNKYTFYNYFWKHRYLICLLHTSIKIYKLTSISFKFLESFPGYLSLNENYTFFILDFIIYYLTAG